MNWKKLVLTIIRVTFCRKLLMLQKLCAWAKYLVLFGPEQNDAISNMIRYPMGLKRVTLYLASHNYGKIKINSDEDLPLEKHWHCIILFSLLSQDFFLKKPALL